ncbi:hypothetical protein BSL78_16317 [Apostichopus japonicus]|uniref:Peptidase A2 domain-containing protein n=1 Tax=Stichopus japonicus TaxID=307972 RepID=A0A2G8KFP0_STIJA|nr:hypothetical protein BSL78_16317 [Apostichopus japonicus]
MADLTFDKAKNKCLADEMAYIATKDYLHTTNIDATNAVYSGQPTHRFKGKAHGSRGSFRYKEAEDSVYLDGVQDERYQSEGFGLYNVTSNYSVSPYMIRMSVGKGKAENISMEIDTGATRSTISESAYMSELANMYPLKKCDFALRSYTSELIPTLGYVSVPVKFKSSPSHLADIIIVQGKCPSLFGRDLLQKINLDWNQIFTVKSEPQLRQKGQNHLGDIGALRKSEIVLPTCQPCDPEGFRELVEKHCKLFSDKADILTPVTSSKWASPTVHVPKANGSVRVCGDYKQVNSVIEDDGYKLPNVQDFFAKLAQEGSQPKVYSVIDLTGAFNQLF